MDKSDQIKNLLYLSLDNPGSKTTMPMPDILRMLVSSYKLGYKDGLNDSMEIYAQQPPKEEITKAPTDIEPPVSG